MTFHMIELPEPPSIPVADIKKILQELFLQAQSDQNIHHNAPSCTIFSKILSGQIAYAPESPLKIGATSYNV